jgi:hypothetical protein
MVTIVEPVNPKLYVTGALSTFIYACTGSADYVLNIPVAYEVLGIFPGFGSAANVDASNFMVVNKSAKTVKVMTGSSVDGSAFALDVMVVARKAGGVN